MINSNSVKIILPKTIIPTGNCQINLNPSKSAFFGFNGAYQRKIIEPTSGLEPVKPLSLV